METSEGVFEPNFGIKIEKKKSGKSSSSDEILKDFEKTRQ